MSEPWERALGESVVQRLADLPASELTAALLEVAARRQRRLSAAEVGRRFAADRFSRPCDLDPRWVTALDAHLLARIPAAYEAVELAPVAPLGACTALGPVHPNQVLPTFRGTEVVADCTNVLALECARRRSGDDPVRLCTTHFALKLPPSLAMKRFYGEEASTVMEEVQPIHYFAGTTQLFLQDLELKGGEPSRTDPVPAWRSTPSCTWSSRSSQRARRSSTCSRPSRRTRSRASFAGRRWRRSGPRRSR